MTILANALPLPSLNVQKQVVTDTHYLNVYEIMNRNEQQLYNDVKRVAIALEKLVKLMTKMMQENG